MCVGDVIGKTYLNKFFGRRDDGRVSSGDFVLFVIVKQLALVSLAMSSMLNLFAFSLTHLVVLVNAPHRLVLG